MSLISIIDRLRTLPAGRVLNLVISRPGYFLPRKGAFHDSWTVITRPFHRSIRTRFLLAFSLAVLGLIFMAGVTIVSARIIIDTYRQSVSETIRELTPVQELIVSIRVVEHMALRHAVDGEKASMLQFGELGRNVDEQFEKLISNEIHHDKAEHAHASVSIPDAMNTWHKAREAAEAVFGTTPGSAEAQKSLIVANRAIYPVSDFASEFHHLSIQDLEARLEFAHSIASDASRLTITAIVLGVTLLVFIGFLVSRSILRPVAELQNAAHKLGEKNFLYRVKLRNDADELGQLGSSFNLASATLQRLYQELERRSTHDGLTNIYNRATFDERLEAESKSADRKHRILSLLMVDIDHFKRINDTFGHQSGDQVLQAVSQILKDSVRPGDVVARYGGEEFAIILPETDRANAMEMAERLRRSIEESQPRTSLGEAISITVSIGCASRHPHAIVPGELVAQADHALYRAKDSGRNRVVAASSHLGRGRGVATGSAA